MMSGVSDSGAGQYPVFDNSPLYLRLTLVFPYTKGMLFQHAVFERDGQHGFAEVFLKPPALHAADPAPGEVFRRGEAHRARAARSPNCARVQEPGGRIAWANWSTSVMLEQYAGKARGRGSGAALARLHLRAAGE